MKKAAVQSSASVEESVALHSCVVYSVVGTQILDMQLIDHIEMVTQKLTVDKPLAWIAAYGSTPTPSTAAGKSPCPINTGRSKCQYFPPV